MQRIASKHSELRRNDEYASLLRQFRARSGLSQRAVARAVDLNPAFIHRGEAGSRAPRDAAEVIRISGALGLGRDELDELLGAAGLWPSAYHALGPDDPTLRALVELLTDPRLNAQSRMAFRRGVEAMAAALSGQVQAERTM